MSATVLATAGMISNPVGWVVGLSILAYGAATFVWDQTHPDPKPATQNLKL